MDKVLIASLIAISVGVLGIIAGIVKNIVLTRKKREKAIVRRIVVELQKGRELSHTRIVLIPSGNPEKAEVKAVLKRNMPKIEEYNKLLLYIDPKSLKKTSESKEDITNKRFSYGQKYDDYKVEEVIA